MTSRNNPIIHLHNLDCLQVKMCPPVHSFGSMHVAIDEIRFENTKSACLWNMFTMIRCIFTSRKLVFYWCLTKIMRLDLLLKEHTRSCSIQLFINTSKIFLIKSSEFL